MSAREAFHVSCNVRASRYSHSTMSRSFEELLVRKDPGMGLVS
jgi:hypothetical protein